MTDVKHANKEESHKTPILQPLIPPKNLFQGGLFGQGLYAGVAKNMENLLHRSKLYERGQSALKYVANRPLLAMPIFASLLGLFTPIAIFVAFALLTTSITFTGFLLAEGAILSMAGIIVGSFLLASFGITATVGTAFSVLYVGLQKLRLVK